MTRKLHEYFASGAQQIWRMYPETETLERFTSPVDVQTLTANDVIDGGDLLPNFQCNVADLVALE